MEASAVLTTYKEENGLTYASGAEVIVPEVYRDDLTTRANLQIQYFVRYTTIMNHAYQCRFTVVMNVTTGAVVIQFGPALTNEKRLVCLADLKTSK